MAKNFNGEKFVWIIDEVIGRGDAGEVLAVHNKQNTISAVMKRPVQYASGGMILRQAFQIENESKILRKLSGLNIQNNQNLLITPNLIDTSLEKLAGTSGFFMVSSRVVGKSLTSILRDKRAGVISLTGQTILDILSGCFKMLTAVHEKGILWNDFKIEHIYFDQQDYSIAFIDWGNGIILKDSMRSENEKLSPNTDFNQMINEVSSFLSQIAPSLIYDLDWPGYRDEKINQKYILLLQKRTSYLSSYLKMRTIENKSQLDNLIINLSSLEDMYLLSSLYESLKADGETVDEKKIKGNIESFVTEQAKLQNWDICQLTLTHFKSKELFYDERWEICGLLLKNTKNFDNQSYKLIDLAFRSDYSNLFWELNLNVWEDNQPNKLFWKIRELGLGYKPESSGFQELITQLSDLVHIKIISARTTTDDTNDLNHLKKLSQTIDHIIKNNKKNHLSKFGADLFTLKGIIQSLTKLGVEIPENLNNMLGLQITAIRSLYQAWQYGELDKSLFFIKRLFLVNPQFNGLNKLSDNLLFTQKWIDTFHEGPDTPADFQNFVKGLLYSNHPITDQLSKPDWLSKIQSTLADVLRSSSLLPLINLNQTESLQLDWLNKLNDQNVSLREIATIRELTEVEKEILFEFHNALRNDLPQGDLINYLSRLPIFLFPLYKMILANYQNLFGIDQNICLPSGEPSFPSEAKEFLTEISGFVGIINSWKELISKGNWESAEKIIEKEQDWQITRMCLDATQVWRKKVLPCMANMRKREWMEAISYIDENDPELVFLFGCLQDILLVKTDWSNLVDEGWSPKRINIWKDHLINACEKFYSYWEKIKKVDSLAMRYIAQTYQSNLSLVYFGVNQLAKMIRMADRAFQVISKPEMANTRLAVNNAKDLIYSLINFEKALLPENSHLISDLWQNELSDFLEKPTREGKKEALIRLSVLNPLVIWMAEVIDDDWFIN